MLSPSSHSHTRAIPCYDSVSPQSGSRLASPCPSRMASACSDPGSHCSRWVPPLSPYPGVPHVPHIPPLILTPYRASCSSPRTCSTSRETTCLVGTRQSLPVVSPSPSRCHRAPVAGKAPKRGSHSPPPRAGIKGEVAQPCVLWVSRGVPSPCVPGTVPFPIHHRASPCPRLRGALAVSWCWMVGH